MDIRKWFISPKFAASASFHKGSLTEVKSKKESSQKNTKQKKRRIIESDSDEEPILSNIKKDTDSKKSPKKNSAGNIFPNKDTPKKKEVTISDFFGSGPIARSQKQEVPAKKKLKEDLIHEDENFQATLSLLDEKTKSKGKKLNGEEKEKSHEQTTRIASSENNSSKIKTESKHEDNESSRKGKTESDSKTSNKKKSAGTKKLKYGSSIEVEIIPSSKKPAAKTVIKEEKPVKPKPRNSSGAANYASYLNREGPRSLGSKEIPEGEENCLAGLTFVITGVLESFERDETKSLVEKYGGKIMTTLTKNTKYIVIGRDAGASKLEKAEKFGTIQLDEDGFLELVRTMPGKLGSAKKKPKMDKQSSSSSSVPKNSSVSSKPTSSIEEQFENECDESIFSETELSFCDEVMLTEETSQKKKNASPGKIHSKDFTEEQIKKETAESILDTTELDVKPPEKEEIVVKFEPNESDLNDKADSKKPSTPSFMWVDKYKPTSCKQIIGQQGDKSNAKKLLKWLLNWSSNRKLNKKKFAGRFNTGDDGSGYKAALLSGPPGVGKTTTAVLVSKEAGFDYFELNASDTRSKKNLQQQVSQLLGNQTLADCFKNSDQGKVSQNHVIVMDEVDGMAGNEDRGGVAELIGFIKASKVPIICICNDRNHTKIRSLSNHCFDLRFQRPRVEQIKASMMSIAFKEHLKVSPEALHDIIIASNQDLRQILHNMSMWSAKEKGLSAEQTKKDAGKGTKHIKMSPFDVLREVFSIGNNPKASFIDKSDLFFHDYSIAPLFVQENYLHVSPTAAGGDKKKHLTLLSEAADSICVGDVIDRQIRSQNSWGLLPTQAVFASVIPGELLRGHLRQMINFPAWLGKNSNRNHMDRVLQELHVHMRMRITGNKTDVGLDYLPLLKRVLTLPLIEREQAGIPEVLRAMEEYYLLREDFDSIIDLTLWSDQKDPRSKIESKIKAAFTKAYNKECGKNPYAVTNIKKKKGSGAQLDEDDVVSEEEEDDSIEKDAMIKIKKPSKKAASSKEIGEPSSSKEKKKNPSKRTKAK